MQSSILAVLRGLSILISILLLFSISLNAQIKIKERVEIAPRASVNTSVQSSDLAPSFSCTVPYSGCGVLWIMSFDYIYEGRARLTMNGQTIVEDIYDQIYGIGNTRIDLGNHEKGDVLTFKMIDPSSGEIILGAQDCGGFEDNCSVSHGVIFINVPACGQEFDWGLPENVIVEIGFANAQPYADRILQPAWEGSVVFREPTLLRADITNACGGGIIECAPSYYLPEGTTFTFNITEGQEHAILYDIYSGNEGVSLSGIPKDGNSGWIRLKAIGDEPSQPVSVIVRAQTVMPGGGGNTCIFHITILPNDLKIIPTKSVITYGDTLRFDVWKKLSDTTYGPLESGMVYDYSLVEGYDAGYLTSPDGSQAGEFNNAWDSPSSIFTAFENIPQGKSTLVKLKAMAWVPEPPPPPCPDCQDASIKQPNNPLPVTNGPMLNRSASKINAVPQVSKTNSIPIGKNTATDPIGIKNKTGTLKAPVGIEKPQPTSLQKNADGSYSFVNRDTTGARLSPKNLDKVIRQQAVNSSQTVLRKNAHGGYSPEKINPITSKTGSSVARTQDEPSDVWLAGIVTIEVVKPSDILLGETKYYTAKPDPDQFSNLIITESSSPKLGDGDKRVKFEDPQIADDAVNNEKIGVYWDYLKSDGKGLDSGVVRVIGRYWKQDTTYKVKLHAVLKELGREGAVEIEVKKPAKLHDATVFSKPYNTTQNIRGESLDIDALCIEYGGKIGIPPQVIKGQMFQESDHTGDRFNPSYRYEPWQDYDFVYNNKQENSDAYMKQPFWVTGESPNPMGEGKDVPRDHQNVKPIYYPTEPISIADYAFQHWDEYCSQSSNTIIDSPPLTKTYREYLEACKDAWLIPFSGEGQYSLAKKLIQAKIKEKYIDPAQTRKAASYGFIQMLYTTALEQGFNAGKSISSSLAPEELNDELIEMPFYKKFTEKNLRSLFSGNVPVSQWPDGWEKTWMNSFKKYNHKPEYPLSVFNNAKKFYPQSK
jgi:hypothetical protein